MKWSSFTVAVIFILSLSTIATADWVRPDFSQSTNFTNASPWVSQGGQIIPRVGFPNNVNISHGIYYGNGGFLDNITKGDHQNLTYEDILAFGFIPGAFNTSVNLTDLGFFPGEHQNLTEQDILNFGFTKNNGSPWETLDNIIYNNSPTLKVGINTSDPLRTLHVVGDVNITGVLFIGNGTLTLNGTGIQFTDDTFQDTAFVPPVAAGWNATEVNKTILLNISAFVGVGFESPKHRLDVNGTVRSDNLLPQANNTGSLGLEQQRWATAFIEKLNVSELGGFSPITLSADIVGATFINVSFLGGDGSNITGIKFNASSGTSIFPNITVLGEAEFLGNISGLNITTSGFYFGNGTFLTDLCKPDGTFCPPGIVDTSKFGGQPALFNDSTTIFLNETWLNESILGWVLNNSDIFFDGDWIVDNKKIYNESNGTQFGVGIIPEHPVHVFVDRINFSYNRTLFSAPNLVGFWRFEEGSGNNATDSSGNNSRVWYDVRYGFGCCY